jgi:8-amino-7-oxononanoate synthase
VTTLIVTDGVFSMDGDLAPLPELVALAQLHDCALMVDDAHGLGVIGEHGRGTLEQTGVVASAVPILVGTLGKAFGTFGAFVAGDANLIDYLIQRARTYIYTTALPPAVAAAGRAALRLAQQESWRRERLHSLTLRFRAAATALGLPLAASSTPIQPLIVGESAWALAMSVALMNAGFWVAAIRPPSVPAGGARLRITLSAAHREQDVDALAETLGQLWRERSAT